MPLTGANCVVYAGWQYSDPYFMRKHFTVSPESAFNRPHTLVTSMFSHFGGYHLLGNMVTLFFFGPEVFIDHALFAILRLCD